MNFLFLTASMLSLTGIQVAHSEDSVTVGVDARVRYEVSEYSGDWRADLIHDDDLSIYANAQLAEKIRAYIRLDLARLAGGGEVGEVLERMIEEAYIEIREINGTPIAAIIFGKQKIAFGSAEGELPGYGNSPLYALMTRDEVIGVTIQLDEILGMAIAASALENGSGDLQFGDGWGFSLAVSRQLTERIQARGSILAQQVGSSENFSDRRASMGLVYANEKGSFSAYLDGIYFEGQTSEITPESGYGVQAGIVTNVGTGAVRVQVAYLQDTAYELAAAYDLPVSDHLLVSPYVRYTTDENGGGGKTAVGVQTRVRADSSNNSVR